MTLKATLTATDRAFCRDVIKLAIARTEIKRSKTFLREANPTGLHEAVMLYKGCIKPGHGLTDDQVKDAIADELLINILKVLEMQR